jgi:TIR domain
VKRAGIRAFVSYSHRDERFREHLASHLAILKRQGLIELWHDRIIAPGEHLYDAIDAHLEQSELVLLLISSDFLASDYCYAEEMRRALVRHERGLTRVIPIIVRPVDWGGAPFASLKALPKDGKAVTSWSNRDEAFRDVAVGIRAAIEDLIAASIVPKDKPQPSLAEVGVQGYQATIVQVGGVGSRLATKTAWLLTEHGYLDAERYITHYFNSAGDVMWVSCPDGFRIISATSPTENKVFRMSGDSADLPYGLLITEQVRNVIVVTCERAEDTTVNEPRVIGTLCPTCNAPMAAFQKYCSQCGTYAK